MPGVVIEFYNGHTAVFPNARMNATRPGHYLIVDATTGRTRVQTARTGVYHWEATTVEKSNAAN